MLEATAGSIINETSNALTVNTGSSIGSSGNIGNIGTDTAADMHIVAVVDMADIASAAEAADIVAGVAVPVGVAALRRWRRSRPNPAVLRPV